MRQGWGLQDTVKRIIIMMNIHFHDWRCIQYFTNPEHTCHRCTPPFSYNGSLFYFQKFASKNDHFLHRVLLNGSTILTREPGNCTPNVCVLPWKRIEACFARVRQVWHTRPTFWSARAVRRHSLQCSWPNHSSMTSLIRWWLNPSCQSPHRQWCVDVHTVILG